MPSSVTVRTIIPDLLITLAHLREIGWREWDPIGLLSIEETWDQNPFADEYDEYLRNVVAHFLDDRPLTEAVEYLLSIKRHHMALGIRAGQEARAEATARAIQHSITAST